MNKQKLSDVKSKVRHYTPEIIVGLSLIAGTIAGFMILKQKDVKPFLIAIDPEMADGILVLEQLTVDTYKDLDFGELYHVTPIRE